MLRQRLIGLLLVLCATAPWLTGSNADDRQSTRSAEHDAFRRLRTQPLPATDPKADPRTPIDSWIIAGLQPSGLKPSPQAPRATLLRRVAFDLTGLPPSEELHHEVMNDVRADWYERAVERLLASPSFGEHWGKHWLDAAGYADSNGYFSADTDRPFAWRYRDWVIQSLAADKPFDQFVREQLAGDELAGFKAGNAVTPEQIDLLIATHFLRNGQDGTDDSVNEPEAHEIDRRAALEAVVQVTCASLLGLTVHCARCHDHKFEAIPQTDYYRLQAIFFPAFNPQDWVIPKNRYAYAYLPGERESWESQQAELTRQIAALRAEFQEWVLDHREPGDVLFHDAFDGTGDLAERYSNTAPGDDIAGGEVHLDSTTPHGAKVVEGRLQILAGPGEAWLSTKQSFDWSPDQPGDWIQATFELVDNKVGGAAAERIGYTIAAHDYNDNGQQSGGNLLIDGNPGGPTTIYFDYPGTDSRPIGAIGQSGYVPGRNFGVRITNLGEGKYRLEHLVDWIPEGSSIELKREDLPDGGFAFFLAIGRSYIADELVVERSRPGSSGQGDVIALREEFQKRRTRFAEALKGLEQQRTPEPGRKIAWVSDKSASPPSVPFLERGLYHKRGESMEPAGLTLLTDADNPLTVAAPETGVTTGRRLAFANWLLRPGSRPAALLARVHANRVWRQYFDRGLVATTDNLGESGAAASHPELLDELARQFVDSGWSQKQLHRLIVLSHVYRQDSAARPEGLARDRENRLLWRAPLRRLSAEEIRDGMLAVSGELDAVPSGPYVPTKQTPVGEVIVDDNVSGACRRSVYLQQRRSQSLSLLKVFDAPAMATVCSSRVSSSVPLQSLAQLNSEFALGRATALARRIEQRKPVSDRAAVAAAYRLVLGRDPTSDELTLGVWFLAEETPGASASQMSSPAGVPVVPATAESSHDRLVQFCQMLLASNPFLYLE